VRLAVEMLGLAVGARRLCSALSFCVEAGELWCILGRNGAGKTTLLRTLAGLSPPEAGRIVLDGRELSGWPRAELARARGFLPQSQGDAFSASVLETVLTGRHPHQPRLADQWRFDLGGTAAGLREILGRLELEPLLHRDILSLSSGERQRVAIAALLMQDAPLMLLDEPTSSLDFDKQLMVMRVLEERLAEAGKPCALLMSVHDINLAARFASHVLLFSNDGLVLAGPAGEVLTAANLSAAYEHPVAEFEAGEHRWFSPK